MRRDEAFAKATEAVSKFSIMRKEAWDEHSGSRPSPPADWLHPTVHQIIAALEAIGVVKFDVEPACPFMVGDLVRRKVRDPFKPRPLWRVVRITALSGKPEDYWDVETEDGNHFRIGELEMSPAGPASRMIHRVPTANQNAAYNEADIYEDTLVETVRMIGYAVVRKEKPPKLPETAYMLCGCAESEFCPQGGVGPRQRCKIPISRNKRWVLERALRVLDGEN